MSPTPDPSPAHGAKPPQVPPPPVPPKNIWDKIDIILKPVGGLLTALAVAGVGYFTGDLLRSQQKSETDARVYAQLMSGREQSDSLLRQEMFKTIISDVLRTAKAG